MQTTLLGLAIAFILALLAALIGPYFVDWNQFRPQFEIEASRVLGTPVRVEGALDARLLPTPTLRLRNVAAGRPNDPGRVAAEKLDVEFSLGSLMRGEWRASELSIDGLTVNLGLDQRGRLVGPSLSGAGNFGGLAIDRLNLTGKMGLYDAASRSTIALDDITFSGDVRALAASVRGEGQLSYNGERYPFKLSTGQTNDGKGTRFRFGVEPGARPLSAYIDGVLSFEADAPHFDGALSVVRTAALKAGPQGAVLQTPWRMTANMRAEPSSAKLEQLELSYGSEDNAFKLTGVADARFGASPLLHVVLAGRQLDADRLLAKEGATSEPAQIIANLRELVAGLPQAPLPVQAEIGVDSITLGGRPVQNVGVDLRADPSGWRVDKLELRAPGATQVTLSGATQESSGFKGAISIDSADPDLLAMWLQGRKEVVLRAQRAMRLRGQLSVTPESVAVDGIRTDLGSGELQGRLAWVKAASGGSRFEAELKTELLDIDTTIALARTAMTAQDGLPTEGSVKIQASVAKWAGQELRPFAASFDVTPKMLTVDKFSVGAVGGMAADGSGAFDFAGGTGKFNVAASGASMSQIASLLTPVAPELASRIGASGETGVARIAVAVSLDKGSGERGKARLSLDIDGAGLKGAAALTGTPRLSDARTFNIDAMSRDEWAFDSRSSFAAGSKLLGLMPLGDIVKTLSSADALQFDVTANGALRAPMRFKANLSGNAIDLEAEGRAEFWSKDAPRPDGASADINLTVRRANLAPLLGQPQALNISLTSRLSVSLDQLTLRDIDSRVGGSRVRGRLAFVRGNEATVEGELGTDVLDIGAVLASAIGASRDDPAAPLRHGLMRGWRGQVTFQALRGLLPGGLELRPVGGTLKTNGEALAFEGVKGTLGGGEVKADIEARPGLNGLGIDARVQFAGVDGSMLRYRSLTMPSAKASLQMSLASRGRSVQALTGSLSGAGSFALDNVRIPNLDPRAFDIAVRAGDAGQPTGDAQLKALLEPVLAAGTFTVPSAQVAFVVSDGRLRVGATTLESEGARAVISGGYDIAADQADMRASMISTVLPGRPEILLLAYGTPDAPVRSLDLTSLSSWLAVRAIDRETRRLDAIERGETPPPIVAIPPPAPATKDAAIAPQPVPAQPDAAPGLQPGDVPGSDPRRVAPARPKAVAPRPPQIAAPGEAQAAPALPPPIEVKPAPGPAPRPAPPKPRPPLVLTPSFSN